MEYRVKEVVENGKSYFYPQYKKRWFWRRFVWWGGEDGTTPHTAFYSNMSSAIATIEGHKERLKLKALVGPDKTVYHLVD